MRYVSIDIGIAASIAADEQSSGQRKGIIGSGKSLENGQGILVQGPESHPSLIAVIHSPKSFGANFGSDSELDCFRSSKRFR